MGQNPGSPVNVVLLDRNSEDVALMERIIEATILCNIRSASSIKDVLQKISDERLYTIYLGLVISLIHRSLSNP